MGGSNKLILPQQIAFMRSLVDAGEINTAEVKKVALLGVHKVPRDLWKYCKSVYPNPSREIFDIRIPEGETGEKNFWDMNTPDWKISGYDLVVAHRVSPFVTDMDQFLSNLKKMVKENKYVIWDFTLFLSSITDYPTDRGEISKVARFDFRETFSPCPVKGKYQNAFYNNKIENSINVKDLKNLGLEPDVIDSKWNSIKDDGLTYCFWKQR